MATVIDERRLAPGGVDERVLVRGLGQRFRLTTVLHDIDLALGTGVFGLLGPNGAGKTTLLRTLATILAPARGELRLLGYDPAHADERRALRRRLGYLPQTLGYYPNFTVWEFVEYFALLKEMEGRLVRPAVARAIERVDLGDRARAKLRTLSGGMLRRVGIAQAIVNDPALLLLDEPTAGLDPEQRVSFRALLREIGQTGTVIVSTHLIEDVAAACATVAILGDGRIVFRGTPEGLIVRGEGHGVGDSPLERGYSRVLAEARA
jgi:ABC-2 type transport system ATP-binding protein